MIYFDARLSAKYPTVEIRVCDVCTELETAVALAALVRALVTTVADGPAPEVRPELLRAADWRAARFGMTERLVDLTGAARLAPAWDLAQALLDVLTPALDTAGDTERVTRVLDRLRAEGTGAERQRAAVADAGDLGAAVDAATLTG
jgi:carboxylate-amine ligase